MSGMSRIIGQEEIVKRLRHFGSLFAQNGGSPGHILIVGQRGMGKRTIARAFAEEFGMRLVEVEDQTLKRKADLTSILTSIDDRSVLLASNIQEFRKVFTDLLTEALENFRVLLEIGQGPGSHVHPFRLSLFTCIATATRETDCPPKLRDAFSLPLQLELYTRVELQQIVNRMANSMGFSIQPSVASIILEVSRDNLHRSRSMLVQLSKVTTLFATEEEARRVFGIPDESKRYDQALAASNSLQELSGIAFEEFIKGLLQRMGFRTQMTKASGDGGVDVIAVLDKPFVRGRYLIQCKRYGRENLVGAPTVRDFFGAVNADRMAVKGILITTSGFTKQAKEFAADVGLELIDGDALATLIAEQNRNKQRADDECK
jgi:HJR/Mrr/RecB family endonuclease